MKMLMTVWNICIKHGRNLSKNGLTFFSTFYFNEPMPASAVLGD